MSGELVARVYQEHSDLMRFLRESGQLSFLATVESSLPKVILLAAASDLEAQIQRVLVDYFSSQTNASEFAVNFVRNKAISRQYHTYFDWDSRSANKFFALFGERFKRTAKAVMAADDDLSASIKSFCEVGDLRNQLVHESYASFTVEKTAQEVYSLYQQALRFVEVLPGWLAEENPPTDAPLIPESG